MDVSSYKFALNVVTLGTAAVSAFCWFRSARAEVPAKADTSGFGALLGGDIVIKNAAGERVDLIDTMTLQSKWNRWAAMTAAISAGAQVLSATAI